LDIGTIKIPPLKVPMELLKEVGIIGASHGWVATLKNGIVCQDDLDLHAPDNNPKRIPLPPLETLPHNQTQIVTNIAMSSSSPEDEDCIVAVKFLGPQLSLCRPAQRDCTWSNIRISDPSFFSSHVMYSKRDEMFSMPSSRGHYTRSWDLVRHMKEPKLQMLMQPPEDQIPRMTKRAWQRLESCCTKQHYLVESSHTDETFMLKWYTQSRPTLNVWDHFLLLKIDKEGNALYTKDIGDLCILLSRSEPICIPAKLNRRAKNCIYMLTEHEFAIVEKSDLVAKGLYINTVLTRKISRNKKGEAAMSHLVRRLKLSKLSLRVSHLTVSQCFSNFIFKVEPCGSTLRDGDVGYLAIHSYIDNLIDCTPKKVPTELAKEMGTIGASHGWVATLKNGVVCLQDDLDLHASYTDPKRISLPPLVTLPNCQTRVVTNVAMSSSSPEDEDCIVAVKFLGPQLSLCRPSQRDCTWSNIRITDPSFFSSHVMYSKRDDMFSMMASGGNYTGSWDLGRHMTEPKLTMLSYPKQRVVKDRYIESM
ncbi:unnamed protein product, partial [Brassica oleracea]